MKTMNHIDFREISNAKISSRLRQVGTLIVAILIGMIISIGVNAQNDFHKSKDRFYKAKFRTQKHQYANACSILDKKRTQRPKSNSRLAFSSKPKYRPMAEIDPPTATAAITKPKQNRRGDIKAF